MSYEIFPIAMAGVFIYGFRDQIKSLVGFPIESTEESEVKNSEYSLEYINPEPVSGSTDIHGAESISTTTDYQSEYRFRSNPHLQRWL